MARYNKIYAGPVDQPRPYVQEAIASVAIKPGRLVVYSSGEFALAGASTVGKVMIAEENYLALKGVDVDWAEDARVIALELLPDRLYNGRIANGVNVNAKNLALTPGANGTLAIAGTSDLVIGYSEEVYNNNTGSEQLIRFRPTGLGYLSAA